MGGVPNGVWQAEIKSLSEGISRLYDTKYLSDVTVNVYGLPFKGHKLILAARSPVFKNMFMNQDKEFSIKQKEVTIKGFEILLHFLYKGFLKVCNEDQKERIIEAYFAGAYFQITSLTEKCITEIDSWEITTDNVFKLLDKGYEIEKLKNRCYNFIKHHPVEVIKSPCFKTASVKCISIILEIDTIRQKVPALDRIKHVMEWGMATFPSSATDVPVGNVHDYVDRDLYEYANVRKFLFENVSFTQNLRLLSILDYHQLTETELLTIVTYKNLLTDEELTCMLKYIAFKKSNPQDLPNWCREAAESSHPITNES